MALSNLWSSTSILYLCTLYLIGLVIYRLVLSPYAAFPGPKLAGLTSWYTFYYDVIKGGQYIYKVQALHERYGRRCIGFGQQCWSRARFLVAKEGIALLADCFSLKDPSFASPQTKSTSTIQSSTTSSSRAHPIDATSHLPGRRPLEILTPFMVPSPTRITECDVTLSMAISPKPASARLNL